MTNRIPRRYSVALTAVVLAVLGPTRAGAADDTVVFAPHRAIYDVELTRSASGTGVTGLTGRMVYELTGAPCAGYTQNMRFVTIMTNEEGSETVNDLRNSSWEAAGGSELRFSNSQYQNDVLADAARGDASRRIFDKADKKPGDSATVVELVKPTKKRATLPSSVYFPIQHAEALIAAAKDGKHLLKAELFDGSEKGEKVYLTSAVIGNPYRADDKPRSAAVSNAGSMTNLVSWPMTVSYFELSKQPKDQTPSYELHFRYYENGVTDDLNIDYGTFAIKGTLKQLTFLEPAKCPAPAKEKP